MQSISLHICKSVCNEDRGDDEDYDEDDDDEDEEDEDEEEEALYNQLIIQVL